MNRIQKLFGITYPIIQAGMIWCSGWELASAVSNAGGLGLIGSGSMYPEILREQIKKGRQIYLVYPLINESEKLDYKDLMDGYESIVREFFFQLFLLLIYLPLHHQLFLENFRLPNHLV